MKTEIERLPLAKDNPYKIVEFEDYQDIRVTTSEGVNKSMLSFPRHKSIPFDHSTVRDAIKQCVDTTRQSLLNFLGRKK